MKRIDVKLSLPVVAPLLDLLRQVALSLQEKLASPLRMEDIDEEMLEIWSEDLLQEQNTEIRQLLQLFDDEFFTTGLVRIDQKHADPILRATASLRMELRLQHLGDIKDGELENGQVDPDGMRQDKRQAFLCYVFLATLQELIIKHLEEGMT